ncbi:MAG: IS3 family transposase [Gammaproteobacteria bacterium]|nr:IS3 family transposase [Gammaproteobacteria bacterium]
MFRATHSVSFLCSALQVTRSTYYARKSRSGKPSREGSVRRLPTLIRSVHEEWKGIFGYRRMVVCLRSLHGEGVGARRARRLMWKAGLFGVPRKSRRRSPIRRDSEVPDLLRRAFSAERPNSIWVTDITQIATGEGKLYLCAIKDLYDSAVVGWKTGSRQTADLVTATVDLAVTKRHEGERPVLHSDHGSQYTIESYRSCLERHGLRMSMGRVRSLSRQRFRGKLVRTAQAGTDSQVPVRNQEGSRRKGRRILPEDLQSAAQSTPGTKRAGANRTDGGDEPQVKSKRRENVRSPLT